MTTQVEIDEIDVLILRTLIRDARTKLKDIAKVCGLSSTAVLRRIERLKATGVIIGALILVNNSKLGYGYPASIEVNLKPAQQTALTKALRNLTKLVNVSPSVGSNSFAFFFLAKSMKEVEKIKQLAKKHAGTNKVTLSLWRTPQPNLENLDLQPTGS